MSNTELLKNHLIESAQHEIVSILFCKHIIANAMECEAAIIELEDAGFLEKAYSVFLSDDDSHELDDDEVKLWLSGEGVVHPIKGELIERPVVYFDWRPTKKLRKLRKKRKKPRLFIECGEHDELLPMDSRETRERIIEDMDSFEEWDFKVKRLMMTDKEYKKAVKS